MGGTKERPESFQVPLFYSELRPFSQRCSTAGDAPPCNATFPTRSSGEFEFLQDCQAAQLRSPRRSWSIFSAIRAILFFFPFQVVSNFSWVRGVLAMLRVVVYLRLYVFCVAGTRSRAQTASRTRRVFDLH